MFHRIPTHLVVVADERGWPVIRQEGMEEGPTCPNLALINPENFPSPEVAWGVAAAIVEGLISQRWRSTEDLEAEGVKALEAEHRRTA